MRYRDQPTVEVEVEIDDEGRLIAMRTTQWRDAITANLEGLRQLASA